MAENTKSQAKKKAGGESGEERSMEDILSSIRRILQEDESEEDVPQASEPSDPEAEASILNVGDISRPQDDDDEEEDAEDADGETGTDEAEDEDQDGDEDQDDDDEEEEEEDSELFELTDDMVVEAPERARPKFEPATAGVDTNRDRDTVTSIHRVGDASGSEDDREDANEAQARSGSILAARIAALSSSDDDEEAESDDADELSRDDSGRLLEGAADDARPDEEEDDGEEELTAERLLDMELEGTEYDQPAPSQASPDQEETAQKQQNHAPEAANDVARDKGSGANVIEQIIHLDSGEETEGAEETGNEAGNETGKDARENQASGAPQPISKEELKPLIDEWIEENLPSLMEKISKR